MLRAGQSLPPKGLPTLRFDAGRFPPTPAVCYRASWQLPGPDSHRLADTSLRVDYLNATTSKGDITSRTHAAGHTKVPLDVRWREDDEAWCPGPRRPAIWGLRPGRNPRRQPLRLLVSPWSHPPRGELTMTETLLIPALAAGLPMAISTASGSASKGTSVCM